LSRSTIVEIIITFSTYFLKKTFRLRQRPQRLSWCCSFATASSRPARQLDLRTCSLVRKSVLDLKLFLGRHTRSCFGSDEG
jgi:hypothetical protein